MSCKSAPFCNDFKEFEEDLFNFIKNVKFNRFIPKSQQNLKKELKNLYKRDRLKIFVDKSRSMYSSSAKYYKKLMNNCLTTTYKVSDDNIFDKTIKESQEIISSKYFNLVTRKYLNSLK